MVNERLFKKSADVTTYNCDAIILNIRRTILKISQHYQKYNEEFRQSKKKKVKENLDQYLLNDEIIKSFVKQLEQREIWFERAEPNYPSLKRYGCKLIDRRNDLVYLMIFLLDDNDLELIKVITIHPDDNELI